MKRRSYAHDYSRTGYYHITITVAKALHQPFGRMAGRTDRADGEPDAPHVVLTPVGKMVEEELLTSISRHYPMLEVLDYVIMPEHLHFLLRANRDVVSKNGKPTHLGHVIAGFKYGCNVRYWTMMGNGNLATESPDTRGGGSKPDTRGATTVQGDSVAQKSRPTLFASGYCDVMPVDEAQLATQRAYIHGNPRSRLMRMTHGSMLHPQRHAVNTAVSIKALHGYLERECPRQLTPEVFAQLEKRLLQENGQVTCDSYGSNDLLQRRLLPVVCHRNDAALFESQKASCLAEAAAGTVLVSARISKGEQDIMDSALHAGFPVIRIMDNGFSELYHPSTNLTDDCIAGRLLLLTPWSYLYQGKNDDITALYCKTMNCLAQAICRTKDDWWKVSFLPEKLVVCERMCTFAGNYDDSTV